MAQSRVTNIISESNIASDTVTQIRAEYENILGYIVIFLRTVSYLERERDAGFRLDVGSTVYATIHSCILDCEAELSTSGNFNRIKPEADDERFFNNEHSLLIV